MDKNDFENSVPRQAESFKLEVSEQGEVNPDEIRNKLDELDNLVDSFSGISLVKEASRESGLSVEQVGKVAQKSGIASCIGEISRKLKQKLGTVALLGATLIAGMPAVAGAQETPDFKGGKTAAESVSKPERVEFGFDNLKRAPLINERGMEATALGIESEQDWADIERRTYGNAEANYWVDQLGGTKDLATVQSAMDHYYLFVPEGTPNRWGDGWLNKFVLSRFIKEAHDLRDQLSLEQKTQLETLLIDAAREKTFVVDSSCGINPGNSCAEDGISEVLAISRLKNLFPEIAGKIGIYYLNNLEKKYLNLALSTENGWYSFVREETQDGMHVVVNNHNQQSAVYAGIVMIYFNLALEAYNQSGTPIPAYYKEGWLVGNIKDTFKWQQSVSTSDGMSYLNACKGTDGSMQSCADVNVTNAIPRVIPSGRLMENLKKAGVIPPDSVDPKAYDYRLFDVNHHAGNIDNRGRQTDFNIENHEFTPKFVDTSHRVRKHLGRL